MDYSKIKYPPYVIKKIWRSKGGTLLLLLLDEDKYWGYLINEARPWDKSKIDDRVSDKGFFTKDELFNRGWTKSDFDELVFELSDRPVSETVLKEERNFYYFPWLSLEAKKKYFGQ